MIRVRNRVIGEVVVRLGLLVLGIGWDLVRNNEVGRGRGMWY